MGDEEDGLPGGAPELEEVVFHQIACLHIESAEGLVHQEDRRVDDERLRELCPLAHAPGELMWEVVGERREPDADKPRIDAVGDLAAAEPTEAERKADVLAHGTPGEQSVSLEQEADVRPDSAYGIVADGDGSDRRRDKSRHQ